MPPRVSIVLAARDEATRIRRSLDSVLAQTLDDWELIVADDGSADGTPDVVRSYGDPRFRVLELAPGGQSAALNRGIEAASAPLIARQDADDLMLPDRLERQLAFLAERPDVDVLGSAWREEDPDGRPLAPRVPFAAGRLNELLPRFNPLTHTTVTFRRSLVERVGAYDEALGWTEDYDLWLRAELAGCVLWNLGDVLGVRVMTGVNKAARGERKQVREELGVRRRDIARRRAAGRPVGEHVRVLARRAAVLATPLAVRRAVRARRP